MPSLKDLTLRGAYHKPQDDIAKDFYLPCMARAVRYDRAVGFFSSSIYILAWSSLKSFVENGGRMRLICSPVLSEGDDAALREGYSARSDAANGEEIRAEYQRLLQSADLAKPARVLASLVALGVVDFKIAWVGSEVGGQPRRLFHDKLGLFTDPDNNRVAFKGSMNETWPGLALDGNLESVDVFVDWADQREKARVEDEQRYFDQLWGNQFPGVIAVPLPETTRKDILASADVEKWPEYVDQICTELETAAMWSPDSRRPRPYQVRALADWEAQNRRGILEHATGSGKTFTALCAMKDSLSRDEVPLIVVPSELLLTQWIQEIRGAFDKNGLQLLICGGGHGDWKEANRLRQWTRPRRPGTPPRAVVSTLQTAAPQAFRALVSGGEHLFLIADEVHRLGANQARQILTLETGPRLGLSATPRRAGDPEGTSAVLAYFGGVIQPPFTIYDAIREGRLSKYAYHVHSVTLTSEEQDRWDKLTQQIRTLVARGHTGEDGVRSELDARTKRLLIQRARVVKSAANKVQLAARVVGTEYRPGQHWIVYCEDQVQLRAVKEAIAAQGCADVLEYHRAMSGNPQRTLDLFKARGGVVVSIRCLDEGVDIPAVSHALILASSKNPREYIQRRGRVLRRFEGKSLAHIHDAIVSPNFHQADTSNTSILEAEIARAIEFGRNAINPACISDLQILAIEHHLDLDALAEAGFEDEDEDSPDQELPNAEC